MIDFDITEAAADKLMDVLDTTKTPPDMMRVSIRGGGCAGFEYQFEIEKNVEEGDYRFEKGGATILIDPVSGAYLHGAELDYVSQMFDSRFVLRNPNAKTTCGCGSSFAG